MEFSEKPAVRADTRPAGPGVALRRINAIAEHIGARSYLEIGVSKGRTFHAVSVPAKVGVDPKFQFEVDERQQHGAEYHEVRSDEYFTRIANEAKFDLIYLDGLHTFQQTFRDFCNSLACAHNRTVWLIDDILPIDVYSALPNHAEAVRFRKQGGGSGGAWHGDVFKVLFAIHDFFPMYSYVSFRRPGNPQAIVWKAPRNEFVPTLNSMEAIERLSYFDLLKLLEILNLKSEPEGFGVFFESYGRKRDSHSCNTVRCDDSHAGQDVLETGE